MNNLFAATAVHPGELLSVAAFEHLDAVRDRARRVVEADRAARGVSGSHRGGERCTDEVGHDAFLRLAHGEADEFLARLRAERETSAVPGRFFGAPDCFRMGMGVNHEMFAEGLRRVEEAL